MMRSPLAALCAALAVLAPSDDYGPFGKDGNVRASALRRCMILEHEAPGPGGGVQTVTFVRGDAKRSYARLRLKCSPSGIFAEVLEPDGTVVAGPRLISDRVYVGRTWWADLNKDGREDFIVEARERRRGPAGRARDIAFFLSSDPALAASRTGRDRYSITTFRTLSSRTVRFVDLGDGNCRFVHTAFVDGRTERGRDGEPHNYLVHNLLEFEGRRVVLAEADPRFPMWVRHTLKPSHKATSIITPEQKKRLWAEVPDRIFGRPPPSRAPVGARETALAD